MTEIQEKMFFIVSVVMMLLGAVACFFLMEIASRLWAIQHMLNKPEKEDAAQ
jgi:hypothetical protein